MKFFIAMSANILVSAGAVFLCYAAATAPTSAYLVAGLVVCFLTFCYLSRKIFAKPLWQTLGFGILSALAFAFYALFLTLNLLGS